MKNTTTILILLVNCLLLGSCVLSKDYIRNVSKNSALRYEKNKRFLVSATDGLSINSFNKTFKKNYETVLDFAEEYSNDVATGLINNAVFAQVAVDDVNKWNVMRKGITTQNVKEVDTLIANTNADYLITIANFNISSRVEMTYVSSGMNNGFGHHNSIEYCVVTADVKIYDLETREILAEFQSLGESSVFMFDYTKTLKKAKERSITHIVNYLKTGRVSYTQY